MMWLQEGREAVELGADAGWDRGALYGLSVFETMRAQGGRLCAWEAHRARLERGIRWLGPERARYPDQGAFDAAAAQVLERVGARWCGIVRLSVSQGEARSSGLGGGLLCGPPRVVWAARAWSPPSDAEYAAGRSAVVVEVRRPAPSSLPPEIKLSAAYAPSVIATQQAEARGADVALMCDPDGALACAAAANVFWVHDGTLHTPPTGPTSALAGTTRAALVEQLAPALGVPVAYTRAGPEALVSADEVFMTASSFGVMALRVSGAAVQREGPVTRSLREAWCAALPGA